MLQRTGIEKREYQILAPKAAKSAETKGRVREEEKSGLRTDFQRDRDRIIHSKAFRRLMHKTQVFLSPEGDHFRTRLTHTLEVSQIARTVARSLKLNEDLTEAIALGHDLGHTPFGHNGEAVLDRVHDGGFKHNLQSLRVVDVLEMHGDMRGMNLTSEVRDGILNHTGPVIPFTLEGQVVRICDRVAYINHDIDDAVRSGVISNDDLPEECVKALGNTHSERISTLVNDLIVNSDGKAMIMMSGHAEEQMNDLRSYMFSNVYNNKKVKKDEDLDKVSNIVESLYYYYLDDPKRLPPVFSDLMAEYDVAEIVKDHVAGMTDRYAMNAYTDIFVPKAWKIL